jgi:hypothetical protein
MVGANEDGRGVMVSVRKRGTGRAGGKEEERGEERRRE